jgi:ATP-binding cassette subfamily F protein 3
MITLKEAKLQRSGKPLLEGVDLTLFAGQKVGITGKNGCGKSTLFQLILGKLSLDNGDFTMPSSLRVAHMAQEVKATDRQAVDYVLDGYQLLRKLEADAEHAQASGDDNALAAAYGELESINGFQAKNQAEQLLSGLGFSAEQTTNPVSSFSGGWRIRLNLAQALMSDSDLLLLDEPTNHLDLDATIWLEQWLSRYQGTLLLISHDRDFLDKVVTHIANFEAHNIILYKGNYSAYERQKAERLMQQQASYEKQQQRIGEIQQFVTRFKAKATKAKQAQSRMKELDRMQLIAPAHIDSPFHFNFPQAEKVSSPLVNIQKGSMGYADNIILNDVSISLLPGSRVGLLGPNGAGKSTLIKTLVGQIDMLNGQRSEGEHLAIGYFAQHQLETLDKDASAFDHIQRLNPLATEQAVRDFLGGFDFRGDRAAENIANFSGGEKARLALAIIAWQKPNLLLLDEPTNHLDLEMRHALELALQGFEGALLVVSHDRHLLRNTVDQFWLVAEGQVQDYDGDLHEYQQWLQQHVSKNQSDKQGSPENSSAQKDDDALKVDKKQQRQQAAAIRKQLSPIKKKADLAEKAMEKTQLQLDQIEQQLANPSLYEAENKNQLQPLLLEQGKLKQALSEHEEQWMELTETLEEMEREIRENSE